MTKEIVDSTHLPVTVKTRLGWDDHTKYIVDVAERLQDVGIEAIAIHGRTRKQMYKGEADWTLISEVANNPRMKIPVFGNGDIDTGAKAVEYKNKYGVDGIMIGRAAIGNPWVFDHIKAYMKDGTTLPSPSIKERVAVTREHLDMSIKWKGEILGINEMKRHYANYFKGIPHFKEYRMKLVTSMDLQEVHDTLAIIEEMFGDHAIELT